MPLINTSSHNTPATTTHNRLRLVMAHTTRFAFKGEARLALDAGVSKSAVSRLVNGLSSPSFAVMSAIACALEKRLGRALDPRELVSFDGTYPTPSACDLCGCRGCSLSRIVQPETVAGQ